MAFSMLQASADPKFLKSDISRCLLILLPSKNVKFPSFSMVIRYMVFLVTKALILAKIPMDLFECHDQSIRRRRKDIETTGYSGY